MTRQSFIATLIGVITAPFVVRKVQPRRTMQDWLDATPDPEYITFPVLLCWGNTFELWEVKAPYLHREAASGHVSQAMNDPSITTNAEAKLMIQDRIDSVYGVLS